MRELAVAGGWLGLVILAIPLWGFTLSVLWAWFVVPKFGAPPLTILEALGIGLVVSLMTKNLPRQPRDKAEMNRAITRDFVRPLWALVVGWVIHSLM